MEAPATRSYSTFMMKLRQLAIVAFASIALLGQVALSAEATVARTGPGDNPVRRIELGDQLSIEVFDNPDLDTTTYVADDGSIRMPLAGSVKVAGSSPDEAARRIEAALKTGLAGGTVKTE